MQLHPEFLLDIWAVPNIHELYKNTKQHIDMPVRDRIDAIVAAYDAIKIDRLPTCFVHGDIIKTNVIMDMQNKPYIIDFSVANVYPRVQEVAVIAANLLAETSSTIDERTQRATEAYMIAGGQLDEYELSIAKDYATAAVAMEYLGSIYERVVNGEKGEEVDYWQNIAYATLMG